MKLNHIIKPGSNFIITIRGTRGAGKTVILDKIEKMLKKNNFEIASSSNLTNSESISITKL